MVDWREYEHLLAELLDKVRLSHFDDIIAIGRGGSIISAYLASRLGNPTFYPIFLRHVDKGDETQIDTGNIRLYNQLRALTGSLLLVDDYLRDGTAMKYAINLLPKNASIETLVMYNRIDSDFKPDFVGEYINDSEIMFPYDVLG